MFRKGSIALPLAATLRPPRPTLTPRRRRAAQTPKGGFVLRHRPSVWLGLLAATAALLAGCAGAEAPARAARGASPQTLVLTGSSTMAPLMRAVGAQFQK